jgi:hypothetical protein
VGRRGVASAGAWARQSSRAGRRPGRRGEQGRPAADWAWRPGGAGRRVQTRETRVSGSVSGSGRWLDAFFFSLIRRCLEALSFSLDLSWVDRPASTPCWLRQWLPRFMSLFASTRLHISRSAFPIHEKVTVPMVPPLLLPYHTSTTMVLLLTMWLGPSSSLLARDPCGR